MKFPTAVVESNPSFIYFVYPFTFDPNKFEQRVEFISNHQLPEKSFSTWNSKTIPTDDSLFHVCNYLQIQADRPTTACFWTLNDALRDRFNLRMNWQLTCPFGEIPFYFGEKPGTVSQVLQLALFKVGVGFAIVRAQPLAVSLHQWLNFLHYFRFIQGQRQTCLHTQKRSGNPATKEHTLIDFIPEGIQLKAGDRLCFKYLLTTWLNLGSLEDETARPQWW